MKIITHVLIGSDNFSNEYYIDSMHTSYEDAFAEMMSKEPNGSLPDTYTIETVDEAYSVFRREPDYFLYRLDEENKKLAAIA